MIYLNDSSMYVGFIKQLLATFNLPKIKVITKEMEESLKENDISKQNSLGLINDMFYIKNTAIYKYNNGNLTFVRPYKWNDKILNITKKFNIVNNIYDYNTHYVLGEYLRFLRDYKKLNLMSMYNCFAYEMPDSYNVSISLSENNIVNFSTNDTHYKIYCLPIKFNTTYTLAIDCLQSFEMACDFFEINNNEELALGTTSKRTNLLVSTYKKISGARYNSHFVVFSTPKYDEVNMNSALTNYLFEPVLKLILKIPYTNTSSITILEGDYSKENEYWYDKDNRQHLANRLLAFKDEESGKELGNFDYITHPKLLRFNTGKKMLLSDRLIEYLDENTIDNTSENYDIKRVQKRLLGISEDDSISIKPIENYKKETYGVWEENIRKTIYKYVNTKELNKKYDDILSYVDKDIEKELGGII